MEKNRKEVKTQKQQIVSIIQSLQGRYTPYEIFTDWIQLMALSIQNSLYILNNNLWFQREEQYKNVMNKYSLEERQCFIKMFCLLTNAYEEEISDILSEIYMEAGCGNKATGQFFTPFHLSLLTAAVNIPADVSEDTPFLLNEPSCGGGGMIIAAAKILTERHVNYQKCMRVVAQDLDWNGVYMTYVQLSLLGINATVVQGNTLKEPYVEDFYPKERIFYTPKKMGVLL